MGSDSHASSIWDSVYKCVIFVRATLSSLDSIGLQLRPPVYFVRPIFAGQHVKYSIRFPPVSCFEVHRIPAVIKSTFSELEQTHLC